jgi:Alginate export
VRFIFSASLAAALLFPCAVQAEDGKLDVSLEIRARVEALDGQFRPGVVESDVALLTRVLLAAEYDAGPFRIGGEVIDARSFFERTGSSVSTTEVDTLEPIQAYIATDLSDQAKLIAGRFTLNLGSRRLVARNAFRNTINSFTGVQAVLGGKARGATLFWMLPQARLPDEPGRLQDNGQALNRERGAPRLFGAYGHADLPGAGEVQGTLLRLAERDDADIPTRNRHLWTAGLRLVRLPKAGTVDWDVEGAYQWGRARQSTAATDRIDRKVAAGFVHAEAGYTFRSGWQLRPALGLDYGSGDGSSEKFTRFDPLYSARGFDFGPTSYYGALSRTNIVSPFARLDMKPGKRSDAQLTARPLWLASATDQFAVTGVRDATGAAGKWAGMQIDARVRRTLTDKLRLAVGALILAKGRFLEDAPNAPQTGDTHYAYVELTAGF